MRVRSWMGGLLGLLATACGLGDSTSALGVPHFREVSAAEAHRLLERPGTLLVQAVAQRESRRPVLAAEPIADGLPLPPGITDSQAVVVFASDADAGLRLAARLARAGIQDVAVVQGGVAAWLAADTEPPSG